METVSIPLRYAAHAPNPVQVLRREDAEMDPISELFLNEAGTDRMPVLRTLEVERKELHVHTQELTSKRELIVKEMQSTTKKLLQQSKETLEGGQPRAFKEDRVGYVDPFDPANGERSATYEIMRQPITTDNTIQLYRSVRKTLSLSATCVETVPLRRATRSVISVQTLLNRLRIPSRAANGAELARYLQRAQRRLAELNRLLPPGRCAPFVSSQQDKSSMPSDEQEYSTSDESTSSRDQLDPDHSDADGLGAIRAFIESSIGLSQQCTCEDDESTDGPTRTEAADPRNDTVDDESCRACRLHLQLLNDFASAQNQDGMVEGRVIAGFLQDLLRTGSNTAASDIAMSDDESASPPSDSSPTDDQGDDTISVDSLDDVIAEIDTDEPMRLRGGAPPGFTDEPTRKRNHDTNESAGPSEFTDSAVAAPSMKKRATTTSTAYPPVASGSGTVKNGAEANSIDLTASSTVATTIKGADSTSDALQAVPNALGKAASTSQVSTDINHLEGVDFTLLLMDEDEPETAPSTSTTNIVSAAATLSSPGAAPAGLGKKSASPKGKAKVGKAKVALILSDLEEEITPQADTIKEQAAAKKKSNGMDAANFQPSRAAPAGPAKNIATSKGKAKVVLILSDLEGESSDDRGPVAPPPRPTKPTKKPAAKKVKSNGSNVASSSKSKSKATATQTPSLSVSETDEELAAKKEEAKIAARQKEWDDTCEHLAGMTIPDAEAIIANAAPELVKKVEFAVKVIQADAATATLGWMTLASSKWLLDNAENRRKLAAFILDTDEKTQDYLLDVADALERGEAYPDPAGRLQPVPVNIPKDRTEYDFTKLPMIYVASANMSTEWGSNPVAAAAARLATALNITVELAKMVLVYIGSAKNGWRTRRPLYDRDWKAQKPLRQHHAVYGTPAPVIDGVVGKNVRLATDESLLTQANLVRYYLIFLRPGATAGLIACVEAVVAQLFQSNMPSAAHEERLREEMKKRREENSLGQFEEIFGAADLEEGIASMMARDHLKTGLGMNGVNPLVPGRMGRGKGSGGARVYNNLSMPEIIIETHSVDGLVLDFKIGYYYELPTSTRLSYVFNGSKVTIAMINRVSPTFSKEFIASLEKDWTIRIVRTDRTAHSDSAFEDYSLVHPLLGAFAVEVDVIDEEEGTQYTLEYSIIGAFSRLGAESVEAWLLQQEYELTQHEREDGLPEATYSEEQISPRLDHLRTKNERIAAQFSPQDRIKRMRAGLDQRLGVRLCYARGGTEKAPSLGLRLSQSPGSFGSPVLLTWAAQVVERIFGGLEQERIMYLTRVDDIFYVRDNSGTHVALPRGKTTAATLIWTKMMADYEAEGKEF